VNLPSEKLAKQIALVSYRLPQKEQESSGVSEKKDDICKLIAFSN
jgi:hypothetical protein